ncbi:MAG: hypothetical protein WED34_02035 [Planctomycetales bacterium]
MRRIAATLSIMIFAGIAARPAATAGDRREPPRPPRIDRLEPADEPRPDRPPTAATAAPSLDETIGRMRVVQERIAQQDPGRETRALQQRIIDDLDRLIEQAKSQPSSAGGGSSANIARAEPEPRPAAEPPTGDASATKQGGAGGERSATANDSEDRVDPGQATDAVPDAQRDLVQDVVWGHLPPDVRRQMLSTYTDKYLPKYDDVVRKYFEALAEQDRDER